MIAGHTKFAVDRLFLRIAQSYNKADIFNVEELAEMISQHAAVFIENGTIVHTWCTCLSQKYSNVPGIRDLHDFFAVKSPASTSVIFKVRHSCYEGKIFVTKMRLHQGQEAIAVSPSESSSYTNQGLVKTLNSSKTSQLLQMYTKFISRNRWLSFL